MQPFGTQVKLTAKSGVGVFAYAYKSIDYREIYTGCVLKIVGTSTNVNNEDIEITFDSDNYTTKTIGIEDMPSTGYNYKVILEPKKLGSVENYMKPWDTQIKYGFRHTYAPGAFGTDSEGRELTTLVDWEEGKKHNDSYAKWGNNTFSVGICEIIQNLNNDFPRSGPPTSEVDPMRWYTYSLQQYQHGYADFFFNVKIKAAYKEDFEYTFRFIFNPTAYITDPTGVSFDGEDILF